MQLPRTGHDSEMTGTAASPPARLSRRATLAGGTLSLAALALAGCATPEPRTFDPPAPQPQPRDELARLRDGADPIVAGETLDGPLLRRFYARRGFQPVWTTRQAQAGALAETVLRAADHGLDPELFHARLLHRMAMFPPLRRELLLSHAVLTYAEALAFGAVPAVRRRDSEDLAPEPLDVTAVLDAGLDGRDPVAAIEALAPGTPAYQALRHALHQHRAGTRGDSAQPSRLRTIEANLERHRWLPRQLPADRVWVNVADQRLVLYRDDRPVFTTRVAVGEATERKQSPEFSAVIEGAFFNPPWVIPQDIVEAYILPRLEREPDFLARNNITLLPNGDAEQAPGPTAGLGVILFDMPNRFDVFLHDTPNRAAFNGENRRISNGCIRVDNPLELAALLMDEPLDAIHLKVATAGTVRKPLPKPVPVFVLYHTAVATADRGLEIRPDFYGRDAAVWHRLQKGLREQDAPGASQVVEAPTASSTVASSTRGPAQRPSRPPPAPRRR